MTDLEKRRFVVHTLFQTYKFMDNDSRSWRHLAGDVPQRYSVKYVVQEDCPQIILPVLHWGCHKMLSIMHPIRRSDGVPIVRERRGGNELSPLQSKKKTDECQSEKFQSKTRS
eukprot:TRINITY_DN2328_c0_g1_i3.p1 TRINITY_DN2328_c0_g1~~TRINITY_DN2328_c0_g1_i3.p1  ORF type:complete len:113 (-),score=7.01 TRINITY_DN2328_c0_g1_i3:9-347(-)